MKSKTFILSIVFIALIALLFGNLWQQSPSSTAGRPQAIQGVIDLNRWDLINQGPIELHGAWEFYWSQLLEPADFSANQGLAPTGFISTPSSWTDFNIGGTRLPSRGYATHRLTIKLPPGMANQLLALKLPRMYTAYKLWANGELVAVNGQIGRTQEDTYPQGRPLLALIHHHNNTVELVLQIANFDHRKSGIWESPLFGTAQEIKDNRERLVALDTFLFGTLLIMGFHHLAMFLFRRSDRSNLYFGLLCVLLGLRVCLVGEAILYNLFPNLSWVMAKKLEYLTLILALPMAAMFISSLYPENTSAGFCKLVRRIGLIFSATLLLPTFQCSWLMIGYQALTVVVVVYLFFVLISAGLQSKEGASYLAYGALFLGLTAINDMIYFIDPFNLRRFLYYDQLSPIGLLAFVFSQSLVLSQKSSKSFHQVEEMSEQLIELNKNLEAMVKKRTRELELTNQIIAEQKNELEQTNKILQQISMVDWLTQVANRHHFDTVLDTEWRRARREKQPLALIMLDIDSFKAYNDAYGHQAGDECLKLVAQAIKGKIKRAGDMVARYGGEEFVVLLPNTDLSQAAAVAESLRLKVESLKIPHPRSAAGPFVTISAGVTAAIPDKSCTALDMLSQADIAMYQAKKEGRNLVKVWEAVNQLHLDI